MFQTRTIQAQQKGMLAEITEYVKETVRASGIRQGIAVVSTPHADAGILCTSFYDPKGHEDIMDDFVRICRPGITFILQAAWSEARRTVNPRRRER